jgi:hypothetical protein
MKHLMAVLLLMYGCGMSFLAESYMGTISHYEHTSVVHLLTFVLDFYNSNVENAAISSVGSYQVINCVR